MQTQLINTGGCKICSKLAIIRTRLYDGLIINFENILRLVLVFLLLTYKHCEIQNGNVTMNGNFFLTRIFHTIIIN